MLLFHSHIRGVTRAYLKICTWCHGHRHLIFQLLITPLRLYSCSINLTYRVESMNIIQSYNDISMQYRFYGSCRCYVLSMSNIYTALCSLGPHLEKYTKTTTYTQQISQYASTNGILQLYTCYLIKEIQLVFSLSLGFSRNGLSDVEVWKKT